MLSQLRFATELNTLLHTLSDTSDLLIIQDLDGVCMPLVRDPLTRALPRRYIEAAALMQPEFFVLTNGEHIGRRGVNTLVDQALQERQAQHQAYLPGLAAGGVQWQDAAGNVSHPGVTPEELAFLAAVPEVMRKALSDWMRRPPLALSSEAIESVLAVVILDNPVSPTININGFHALLQQHALGVSGLIELQRTVQSILLELLEQAEKQGLVDSFFIHYAPNLGTGPQGERIKWATDADSGTTDFQFMLQGAVKEVGVLVILNRYYQQRTGTYPLGECFNARQAPRDPQALLQLAQDHFDPDQMPRIIGVGDTVTSQPDPQHNGHWLRGGSDRGFLSLVQALGTRFHRDNAVLFVDSSGGELKRPSIQVPLLQQQPWQAMAGISDQDDPLHLNVVFPDGHQQYVDFYCRLAQARHARRG
ncbi:glucosylglycerol 3-phosphatase [Ketobacter sp.]|uniref:glucosylglycerol 3-phosphatase n=1 Tax=Ketobacter sp. TaxID=2083498 RepID=UPI000F1DFB27|nr:glucosylglycerol 3-phosphatase [Ketobacter sp.]RLU00793.1 MAG: glucosylglycerol 3-phosphatase [Ketobacter sp.]